MTHRILVVEDDSLIALDLARTLARLGHEVVGPVATGEEAVALVSAERPGLVLMDIRLAGEIDGVEAAARIREADGPPVLFLTAHSDRATVARAVGCSPIGYLMKPFDERSLEVGIAIAFYKHEAERRLRQHAAELEQAVAERTADLRSRERELQLATRTRKDFLLTMSDQLRTPLNEMIGICDLLAGDDGAMSVEQRAKWAHAAAEAGRTLLERLDDILNLASLEFDRVTLRPSTVYLYEVLRAAHSLLEGAAARKGLEFPLVMAHDADVQVIADAPKLAHALTHLLANAIKFTTHGSARIEAARVAPDQVEIAVVDTGRGIAAEDLAHIVEAFSAESIDLHKQDPAPGVGLTLANHLIRLHGSALEISSDIDRGTRIDFRLPVVGYG